MQYQIINLETGDFQVVTLEEAAQVAQLDPHDIAWAIEEHGVCETDIHQITKVPGVPDDEEERDASDDDDAGDADSISPLPVFVYISQEEFEAHLAGTASQWRGFAPMRPVNASMARQVERRLPHHLVAL